MIGKTLSHYKITEQLGKGGMGEVYLADDTTLDRKVALKFLPDVFTGDPERMARFEREAKLLASLNHPNIAGIYGLEQSEGSRFLVLEYVEGETLKTRLSKGALPLEDALELCRQIAEGLEAAHEKGVIHRDLKPGNVMIKAEEKVKILDFGLAKALADESQKVDPADSPTITDAMTRPGVVLGTAAYMSPEQAKGKSVDKRADIWAFGCILYECLTGKRAFEGETVTETLAAVIKEAPDLERAPVKARALLRRCLEKDPKKRLRDIGEAMAWIEVAPESELPSATVKRLWLAWSVAVVAVLISISLAWVHFRAETIIQVESTRFQITPPMSLAPGGSFALSPDGRHLAFAAINSEGLPSIWIRALDSFEARMLPGTEAKHIPPFFWSPDSRSIVFDAGGKLKRIDVAGGPTRTICDMSWTVIGGSWNHDGTIILGTLGDEDLGLMRVSAADDTPSLLTKKNTDRQESGHYTPTFLPDDRHFLYFSESELTENTGIYIGSLDYKPEEQGSKKIVATNFQSLYVPPQNSVPGHLLFVSEQTLMAQAFDEKRLELIGDPIPIAGQVGFFGNFAFFSVSANGTLVYRSGGASQYNTLTWFDRKGNNLGPVVESGFCYGVALSPGGKKVAASLENAPEASPVLDLQIIDFSLNTTASFTFGQGWNIFPIWSPDGNFIAFASNRDGKYDLFRKLASGEKEEELLWESENDKSPTCWSSDGHFLIYYEEDQKTKSDIWILPLEGDRKPRPILHTENSESDGRLSPDMRWLAYVSDESGDNKIYIREFTDTFDEAASTVKGKWLISGEGGMGPRWREDGKELYYRTLDGKVMAVEIVSEQPFQAGRPKILFQPPPDVPILSIPTWDVSPDGSRFILPIANIEDSPAPFNVVINWTSLIEQ